MIIVVDQFPVSMYIGHLSSEREEMQDVYFSLELDIDRHILPRNEDKLATTVDYGAIMNTIAERFTEKEFSLIETTCDEAGFLILEHFSKVRSVAVTVEKSVLPTKITRTSKVKIKETYHRGIS